MILLKFGGITMPKSKVDKSLEEEDEEEIDADSEDSDGETIPEDDEF